jgi:hypothetical protein
LIFRNWGRLVQDLVKRWKMNAALPLKDVENYCAFISCQACKGFGTQHVLVKLQTGHLYILYVLAYKM